MIYFDNSATTFFKPPEVINALKNSLKFLSANGGRGSHRLAVCVQSLIYKTRQSVAELVNCQSSNVIFTSNCTEALNLAIFGSNLSGNVVTTVCEHNSILRPLNELKNRGNISITYTQPNEDSILQAINGATTLVALSHVSNVTGREIDIQKIGNFCYKKGIPFLVDSAQSLGYKRIDMQKAKISMLAAAPHKGLHAPQGIGFLAVNDNVKLSPIKMGGTGTSSLSLLQPNDMPEGFEAGTLNTPGIASLCAAVNYTKKNFEENQTRLGELHNYLIEKISTIKRVKIYSDLSNLTGIVSFNLGEYNSMEVGDILNEQYDIALRTGLHCAPLTHKYYGTENRGMVRVSLGIDNTYKEIDFFINALKEISAF